MEALIIPIENSSNDNIRGNIYTYDSLKNSLSRQVNGYEAPRNYIDTRKIVENRKFKELEDKVIRKQALYPDYKVFDKEGNLKMPIKKSIFDEEAQKHIYRRNDVEEKFPLLVEKFALKQENLRYSSLIPKNASKGIYASDRRTIFDENIKRASSDFMNLSPEKQISIDAIKQKINSPLHEESYLEKMKKKYTGLKVGWSKDIRASFLDEASYIGEKSAFYNEKQENNASNAKNNSNFNPDKNKILRSIPKYSFSKIVDKSDVKERKEVMKSQLQEKEDQLKDKWASKNVTTSGNAADSYNLMSNRGHLKLGIRVEMAKSDILLEYKQKFKHPSPDKYFMIKKERLPHTKGNKLLYSADEEDNEKLFVNMNKINKFVYRPLKKGIF